MATPIAPESLKNAASRGLDNEALAGHFEMLLEDFEKALEQKKELRDALEIGRSIAKKFLQERLWEKTGTNITMLLLMAKIKLGLNDPMLDKMTGGSLELALQKVDKQTKDTMAKLLGVKKE